AANIPTEEVFTSPEARATSGTFRCTFPLSFRGRLIEGLRGEFAGGRLVRLDADSDADRDFVAAYLDTDKNGRRLGEVALVDASSRIGGKKRVYFNTLLDENAAAHIAFGSGFGGTRADKPERGINRSTIHLDVMIGSPKLEVTGIDARGRRKPLIRDGLRRLARPDADDIGRRPEGVPALPTPAAPRRRRETGDRPHASPRAPAQDRARDRTAGARERRQPF